MTDLTRSSALPTAPDAAAAPAPPSAATPRTGASASGADVSPLAAVFGGGTRLRGARVFHPRGQASTARVLVTGGVGSGCAVLDEPGEHAAVVRLSRALGLPRPLPDAEGLALRLPGLGVGGAPLDLLINTAWRFVFVPRVLTPTWSSLLPYDTGSGRRVLVGAQPRESGFSLLVADLLGPWREWGRLVLDEPFDGEDLRFLPTVGADDLVPVPLFRGLRAGAYRASQAARS